MRNIPAADLLLYKIPRNVLHFSRKFTTYKSYKLNEDVSIETKVDDYYD